MANDLAERVNSLSQPVGEDVPGWSGAFAPDTRAMEGRLTRLVGVDPKAHAAGLFEAFAGDKSGGMWTYMPVDPFSNEDEVLAWLTGLAASKDPLFFAIIEKATGKAVGVASFLRINPEMGGIEVGYISYSPRLQKTVMASEAMYLMMARVFDDWGYRRYEWKCDDKNAASRRAALRFGFQFEGIFRQAMVYKGRNRDTAWFSIIDKEWPELKLAFEGWLAPGNFDENGGQIRRLEDFRKASED